MRPEQKAELRYNFLGVGRAFQNHLDCKNCGLIVKLRDRWVSVTSSGIGGILFLVLGLGLGSSLGQGTLSFALVLGSSKGQGVFPLPFYATQTGWVQRPEGDSALGV